MISCAPTREEAVAAADAWKAAHPEVAAHLLADFLQQRAYAAADKTAAGDFGLKLGQIAQDLDDLRSRLVVSWGALKSLKPPTSPFSSRMRR